MFKYCQTRAASDTYRIQVCEYKYSHSIPNLGMHGQKIKTKDVVARRKPCLIFRCKTKYQRIFQ